MHMSYQCDQRVRIASFYYFYLKVIHRSYGGSCSSFHALRGNLGFSAQILPVEECISNKAPLDHRKVQPFKSMSKFWMLHSCLILILKLYYYLLFLLQIIPFHYLKQFKY